MPKTYLLQDFLRTWEEIEDGQVRAQVCGQKILIDHILIHNQLGISSERVVDVANATFQKVKTTLRKIIGPHAFVENGQWSVIHMKEEFHIRLAAILQIIYQQEKLTYCSN